MCISTIAAFRLAASDNIFSSPRPALTSLMMDAPASRAALATSGFEVSIEMEILILARSFSITGTTRCNSSFTETGWAPGRVDCEEFAAVRKRIGRDVEDSHDHPALGKIDAFIADFPNSLSHQQSD